MGITMGVFEKFFMMVLRLTTNQINGHDGAYQTYVRIMSRVNLPHTRKHVHLQVP